MDTTQLIDLEGIHQRIQGLPPAHRLGALLREAGCTFSETHPRIVTGSSVKLWTVGGLPLWSLDQFGFDLKSIVSLTESSMGCIGAMSYLSLPGGSGKTAFDKIAGEHGHTSIAHGVSVSLVVAGSTCAVENEFNSQRDLVHLGRITVARTAAQDEPLLCALEPYMVGPCAQALESMDALARRCRDGQERFGADEREAINTLYGANKASAFVITASLRNFQRLLGAIDDPGKEKEYRRILGQIESCLAPLWPVLF